MRGDVGFTAEVPILSLPATSFIAIQIINSTCRKLDQLASPSATSSFQIPHLSSSSSTSQIPRFASSIALSSTLIDPLHSHSSRFTTSLRKVKKDSPEKGEQGIGFKESWFAEFEARMSWNPAGWKGKSRSQLKSLTKGS